MYFNEFGAWEKSHSIAQCRQIQTLYKYLIYDTPYRKVPDSEIYGLGRLIEDKKKRQAVFGHVSG